MRYGKEISGVVQTYTKLPEDWVINGTKIDLNTMPQEVWNAEGFYEIEEPLSLSEDAYLLPLVPEDLQFGKYYQNYTTRSEMEIMERDRLIAQSQADQLVYNSNTVISIHNTPDGSKRFAVCLDNDGNFITIQLPKVS